MNRRAFLGLIAGAPLLKLMPAPAPRFDWNSVIKIDCSSLPASAFASGFEYLTAFGPLESITIEGVWDPSSDPQV